MKIAALLLSLAGLLQAQSKGPAFEVASVRLNSTFSRTPIHFGPDSVKLTGIDLRIALILAYGVRDFQIDGPDWLRDNNGGAHFNVDARAAHAVPEDQLRLMLRPLLADRFHLTLHHDQKEMPVIALRPAGSGAMLRPTSAVAQPDTQWLGFPGVSQTFVQGHHAFTNAPLEAVAAAIGICTGNALPPVIDQTNLKGRYDFTLRDLPPPPPDAPAPTDDDKLAACRLIAEQDLGLTLNRAKAPVDILVIDHADKVPTEN